MDKKLNKKFEIDHKTGKKVLQKINIFYLNANSYQQQNGNVFYLNFCKDLGRHWLGRT